MTNKTIPIVILASGGLDSTACIAYYLKYDYAVKLIWVNYGQKAALMEGLTVRQIAKFYKLPLQTIALNGLNWNSDNNGYEYPARNAIMSLLGVAAMQKDNGLVAMGIHSGTNYVDCSYEFQGKIADLVNLLSQGRIEIDFPFGKWQKYEIAQFCVQYQVPVKLTYSCLVGKNPPCGKCESCIERNNLSSILDKTQ